MKNYFKPVAVEPIPEQEFEDRLERLREAMKSDEFDVLLVFGNCHQSGNIRYLSNYRPFPLQDFTFPTAMPNATIVIPKENIPTLFVPPLFVSEAKEDSFIKDVRPQTDFSSFIKDLRVKTELAKIGICGQELVPNPLWELYVKSFEDVEVKSSDIVAKLRMVKSERELAWMELAAKITVEAIKAAIDAIQEGVREYDIAMAADKKMLEQGAPERSFDTMVMSGPRIYTVGGRAGNRRIQRGDMILIDLGAKTEAGYSSDIARTVGFKIKDPKQEEILKVLVSANDAGQKAAKPGVMASEIDKAVKGTIEDAGYGKYFTQYGYHGMGLEFKELLPPSTILKPSVVLNVLSCIFYLGVGGGRIENNVVITPEGNRILTNFPSHKLLDPDRPPII